MVTSEAIAPFQPLRHGCKRSILQTHHLKKPRCGAANRIKDLDVGRPAMGSPSILKAISSLAPQNQIRRFGCRTSVECDSGSNVEWRNIEQNRCGA